MPGGRNKYTGPVNYSAEEVGDILNGSFYAALPSSLPTQLSNTNSAVPQMQQLSPQQLQQQQQQQSQQNSPSPAAIAAAQAHAKNLIQKAFQMPNYYQLHQQQENRDQQSPTQPRVQKRRRSLASEQAVSSLLHQ